MKFLSYLMLTILALFTITSLALATPLSAQQPVAVIATNVLPSFPANSPSGATYTANAPLLISPTNVLSLQTSPPFALNDSGSLIYSAPPQQSYYFTNTAANVSGFNRISPFPIVPSVLSITSPTLSTGNTLIYNGISNMSDLSFFPFGTYVCHIHAAETTGTAPVQLYCKIELAQPNGAIIASVATTQLSNDLTSSNIEYRSFYFDSDPFFFSPNERIVVQVYADVGSGGTSPKVTLYMGQNSDSHIAFPSSMVSAVNNNTGSLQIIGGNNIGVKGIGQNIQINAIPAGSNTDIQYNNNGVFGASNVMTFNSITQTLNTKNLNINKSLAVNNVIDTISHYPYITVTGNASTIEGLTLAMGSPNDNITIMGINSSACNIFCGISITTPSLTLPPFSTTNLYLNELLGSTTQSPYLNFSDNASNYYVQYGDVRGDWTGAYLNATYGGLEVWDSLTHLDTGTRIDPLGNITDGPGARYDNFAVCYLSTGELGHCTSAVGMTGTCTCAANT